MSLNFLPDAEVRQRVLRATDQFMRLACPDLQMLHDAGARSGPVQCLLARAAELRHDGEHQEEHEHLTAAARLLQQTE